VVFCGWPRLLILERLSVRPFAVVGHRGAAGRAPENTLRAVEYAIRVGVDVVEVDVRATGDSKLVVLHDPDFKRLAGLDIPVGGVDYGWIRENVRVGGEPVPLLEEVLELVRGADVGLFIEIKEPPTVGRVVELVRRYGLVGRVAIVSFHDEALVRAGELEPGVALGLIYSQPPGRVLDAARLGARVVLPHHRLATRRAVDLAHRYGLRVVAWTVNDRGRALELVGEGVDGLASDVPDEMVKLRSELRQRGGTPKT
jgi:glycerophosphoryl diester phosphodiesterase